jgi:hypothetical protein
MNRKKTSLRNRLLEVGDILSPTVSIVTYSKRKLITPKKLKEVLRLLMFLGFSLKGEKPNP